MPGSSGDTPEVHGREATTPGAHPWPGPGPDDAWWAGRPAVPAPLEHRPVHADQAVAGSGAPPDGQTPAGATPAGEPPEPRHVAAPAPRAAHVAEAVPARGSRGPRVIPVPARPARHPKPTRAPATALLVLVPLALLAAFFAWVSVEPFWLAVGHADRGTATVTRCTGAGLQRRCLASFQPATGRYTATGVALAGAPAAQRQPGARLSARMVSAHARLAYVGHPAGLHLRWTIGLLLVLGCGFTIAWGTGAYRLPNPRARMIAASISVGTPLLIALGLAAATF